VIQQKRKYTNDRSQSVSIDFVFRFSPGVMKVRLNLLRIPPNARLCEKRANPPNAVGGSFRLYLQTKMATSWFFSSGSGWSRACRLNLKDPPTALVGFAKGESPFSRTHFCVLVQLQLECP